MATTEDAAYAAGIMDGEGSFCVCSIAPGTKGSVTRSYRPSIEVGMVDKQSIALLQKNWGGNILQRNITRRNGTKPYYHWYLRQDEMPLFLNEIYPFLRIKQPQAALLLKFLALRRPQKGGPGNFTTEHEYLMRKNFYEDCAALNRREPVGNY